MRPPARWVVRGDDRGDGWRVRAPERWDPARHMPLLERSGNGAVVAGFDVPLGVPHAWARAAGVESFGEVLARLADPSWPRFAEPAEVPDEIGPRRPFYPRAPGGSRQAHLVEGLGLDSPQQLLRACDRPVPGVITAAAPVFWLVGPQQVGKAAISAWREVVVPAVAHDHVRMWPFDGALPDLLAPGSVVLAECYPRAAYTWPLGFPGAGWSKRRQADRRARGREALAWTRASGLPIHLDPAMRAAIDDGFGAAPSGEDPFDATMGALQMIAVLDGLVPAGPPPGLPPAQAAVEGWILGRPAGD